jgi:hypothetical protein
MHWLEWPVVTIRLLIGGYQIPVSFLGEDFLLLMTKPESDLGPCEAAIRIVMADIQQDWNVRLTDGLSASRNSSG